MEESEDNMSAEDIKIDNIPIKVKPKKRSLVERELETSLTARVTSPLTNGDAASRSRYGRARRLKSISDPYDSERNATKHHKSPKLDKSPSKLQSPAYKMHASNSPVRIETPNRDSSLENQIENIYNENISLSRFSSEEKACKSATKKFPKVYIRKDLIQSKEKEDDTVVLIKNMFSPSKSGKKPNTHLSNYLERSSEKYDITKPINGYLNTSSVVKTLDFDGKKKKREEKKTVLSKSELFDLEAQCEYQVGDLAWARMGTYPFWPCIITRDPLSGMFVKKKLFGRTEREVLHVTFFGDNGRRGWIVGSMLRKFLGQMEFEAARANFPPEAKKKEPRLHAAFFISEKKMPQWQVSVDEAEMLLKEPKRLRIDILNDMLQKVQETKTTPKHEKSKTIVRASTDVSLSESLLDTLFSEDDSKGNDVDRSRRKSRNRSFDVSEVVTACLDNMAAKTGITKIQRQSHMDRWLQKAKSKTPEKSHLKSLSLKIEKDIKVSNTAKCKKKLPKKSSPSKHYNFRKIDIESQCEYKLLSHQNEHDYSLNSREINEPVLLDDIEIEYENAEMLTSDFIEPGSGLGFISKVETLCGKEQEDINDQNDVIMTVINDEFIISDTNDIQNMDVGNQVYIQNNHGQSLDADNELVLKKGNHKSPPASSKESEFMEIQDKIELEVTEVMESKNTHKYKNNLETSSLKDTSIDTWKDSNCVVSHNNILNDTTIDNENILNDTTIDNETLEVYESHVQISDNKRDNNSATIVSKNNSLFDVAIETATVTVDQNNFVITSNIQDAGSKMDPDIHLNTINELTYKNFSPDITSNRVDENILGQVTPKNERRKENIPHTSSFTTLPNVTFKDDIEDFYDLSTKISDKNTSVQPSVMKEDSLQNKVINFNNCNDINTITLSTQSQEVSYVPDVKNYVDDGIEDFPDTSKDTGEKTKSTENKTTNSSTQNLEVFHVISVNEYVDDGIEDFPTEPENIGKESSIKSKTTKSNSSSENKLTSCKSSTNLLCTMSSKVSEFVDEGIEDLPEKSTHNLDKKNFELKTPDSVPETVLKCNLPLNKELNLNNSTEDKLTYSITLCSEVSNVVNFKEYADDGIEDFHDNSKNIKEKPQMEFETPNKETIIGLNLHLSKELNSKNITENKPINIAPSTEIKNSLEVLNLVNSKEYADDEIEDFPDISKNIADQTIEHVYKDTVLKKTLHDKELESNSSNTEDKTANWSTKSNVASSKKYDDDKEDFPNVSTKNDEKSVMSESKSLRQNYRERREFETQLYNIFGLSNKNSPRSKLNLSINKSCCNFNSTDVVKIIDNEEIDTDDELECTQKQVMNENALLNIIEVGSAERELCTEKEQSNDVLVNIENEIMIEQKPSLQMVSNMAEENISVKETKRQSLDSQNSSVENQKENALSQANCPKKSAIESDTEEELIVVKVAETIIDEDNDVIDASSIQAGEKSPQKINPPTDHKMSHDTREALNNPDFLKYLELRQDALVDEQPDLTEVEITNYLCKTWLYKQSLKTDIKKTDDIQNTRLVNGLKHSPIKIKLSLNKSSKKHRKTYKVQITNDNENNGIPAVSTCDKKMKTVLNKVNKNKNADCISRSESLPKRSKRIKRNNHYSTSFQNYFLSSVKKDSFSNNVLELIPKECNVQEKDNCQIKTEIDANEVDICKNFETVSTKSPTQNSYKNVQDDKQLHFSEKTDCIEHFSPKVSVLVTQNIDNQAKLSPGNASLDDEESLAAHQLRLTLSKNQSACVADGEIIMKQTTDIKEEAEEDDADNVSVKSESSESSTFTKKFRAKDKQSDDKRKPLEEPEFLKYLELKQDTLIDEHPELTLEEITNYLYKTWLYEESLKNDVKKADDETVTNLVKGLNQDAAPVRRARKKRVEKDKQIDFNLNSEDMPRKEKSKRKIIKPYFYRENFSDIEDDIEFFEIFKPTSKTNTPVSTETIKIEGVEEQSLGIQMMDVEVEFATNEIDEVEEYFRQLTVPKPNVFKGLLREKVCEICEKGVNLVKCKGCHCMFHVECVRKKPEVVEATMSVRGRKKKKKTRGRKAKDHSNSLDSECHSDERSQDLNASDEMHNTSIENETESIVIANADDFEAQLALKMKELLENPESKQYESFSSADELDWNDTDYGECKVVDVLPRKKDREVDIDYSNFKCNNCEQYDIPVCFVCKSAVSPKDKAEHRQRCQVAHCHRYYHLECLDHWPQTQFNAGELSRINNSNQLAEALTCPRHVCHTCVCDDPRGCKTRFSGDKLARCVRCPATYHTFTKCLPAGTQILTASHIICPRHYEHRPGKVPCHVNTGWCFICALGGTLICCEYCPTSFHAECLNIDPPEGGYMCEDCETGRLPLYGEMVWVKLGHYRWWPGIILHPSEIPQNILAVKHSQGEFVVRFFGQYDYYWVNRGRVFPFQEGDSGRISNQKTKIDAAFTMAMEHAQRACEILKTASPNEEESMDIASSLLPPHYVKLKVNKPCGSLCGKRIDIEESSLTQCECDPNELDPCGPYTQCLNRMLLTECGPTCRTGDRCNNRAFEKRLYPKMTPYRTPHRGWGLKTLEDIKAGQFVIEYVGELIDEEEFRRRMRRKYEVRDENFYYLTLDKERMIDAGPKGNLARFMNHSCEPNCETQKWTVLGDVRVGLFALYDIPANSELTFNYNLESTGIEKKQCMCGAKRCSGYIGEKPKQDDQPKKNKLGLPTKRTYKKRKPIEASPSPKPKQRAPRPYRPRELTEIEKDLLIIKNATNGVSSDSESSRLSIESKDSRGLKRKKTEDTLSPSTKKTKTEKLGVVLENGNKYQDVLT